jgi:hypothetical protein
MSALSGKGLRRGYIAYDPANRLSCLLFGIAFVLLLGTPTRLFGIDLPLVWAALVPVFVLGMTRPSRRSLVIAFGLGLLMDFVLAGPVGPFALGFLWAYIAASAARPGIEGGGLAELTGAFAMCATVCALPAYFITSIAVQLAGPELIDPSILTGLADEAPGRAGYSQAQLFAQWLATVVTAPALFLLFGGVERLRLGRRASR